MVNQTAGDMIGQAKYSSSLKFYVMKASEQPNWSGLNKVSQCCSKNYWQPLNWNVRPQKTVYRLSQ